MENGKISIVIVEDHPVMRNGLAAYFRDTGRWEVCGTASTIVQAKELLVKICPDLVLLDIQLEDGWGLDIIPWLNQQNLWPITAVYSTFDGYSYISAALGMGVKAYITKRRSESELEGALLKALNGEVCIDETAQIKFRNITDTLKLLTSREAEIFNLAKSGLSNKQIAAHLGISRRTVENMISSVYSKTGISSRMELVAL
ncbi:MAG: response regulator transcription factor [Treponema sp.]|jgi:NarL family two-component system response regulator LiaR|nr:response regulator transcription factor [Treponema sp.]